MRSTVVPAQVTTVEDKIAGNLGLSQLLLLTLPVFGSSILFVVLPPFFSYAVYKIMLIIILAVISSLLAIRINGMVLLFWIIAVARYNLRPKYYVFNKNCTHLRDYNLAQKRQTNIEDVKTKTPTRTRLPQLSTADLVHIEDIIANPQANLHFRTNRKGVLSVHITEVR